MADGDRAEGPGRGLVITAAVLGVAASLCAGFLTWAVLNSWLADYWIRGIATLIVGVVVAGVLLRVVVQTARGRLRALRNGETPRR